MIETISSWSNLAKPCSCGICSCCPAIVAAVLVGLLIALGNAGVFLTTEPVAEGIRNIPVLNVHPLFRLFEFVLGMSAAVLWERLAARRPRC